MADGNGTIKNFASSLTCARWWDWVPRSSLAIAQRFIVCLMCMERSPCKLPAVNAGDEKVLTREQHCVLLLFASCVHLSQLLSLALSSGE
jgi:hypothetical protein